MVNLQAFVSLQNRSQQRASDLASKSEENKKLKQQISDWIKYSTELEIAYHKAISALKEIEDRPLREKSHQDLKLISKAIIPRVTEELKPALNRSGPINIEEESKCSCCEEQRKTIDFILERTRSEAGLDSLELSSKRTNIIKFEYMLEIILRNKSNQIAEFKVMESKRNNSRIERNNQRNVPKRVSWKASGAPLIPDKKAAHHHLVHKF